MLAQLTALLLVEVHLQPSWPLPRLAGFSRQHVAARPDGRGGVAILLADWWPVQAALWRSTPADGRLWLRVTGLLPDDCPLMLGVAYLPPRGSGGCPADLDGHFLRWQLEVAEAEAEGPVLCGLDGNARVGSEADWPARNRAGRSGAAQMPKSTATGKGCSACAAPARCASATAGGRGTPAEQPPASASKAAAAPWWTSGWPAPA